MIYFIRCNQYVKIGFCERDPIRRLEKLQIGNPSRLRLVAVKEGSRQDEGDLHCKFHKERVRGEWFNLSERIRKLIDAHAVDHDEWSAKRPTLRINGVPMRVIDAYLERAIADAEAA